MRGDATSGRSIERDAVDLGHSRVLDVHAYVEQGGVTLETRSSLEASLTAEVVQFLGSVSAAGGEEIGEEQLLALRSDTRSPAAALLARSGDGELLGYGQLLRTVDGWVAERVLAAPLSGEARGDVDDALFDGLVSATSSLGGGRLELWARAAGPAEDARAARFGLQLRRRLLQLRRALPMEGSGSASTAVRPFRVGLDEQAWLELNARAFGDLPDQGGWTLAALSAREHQPWFDPAGFLLHEEGGRLLAFCWTKLHVTATTSNGAARSGGMATTGLAPLIGEIYVIGVDPSAQGRGLGKAMLRQGCDHLLRCHATEVMLYVDATNVAGLGLYASTGFAEHHEDHCYTMELHPTQGGGRSGAGGTGTERER
jgi:mycothiol synthase